MINPEQLSPLFVAWGFCNGIGDVEVLLYFLFTGDFSLLTGDFPLYEQFLLRAAYSSFQFIPREFSSPLLSNLLPQQKKPPTYSRSQEQVNDPHSPSNLYKKNPPTTSPAIMTNAG